MIAKKRLGNNGPTVGCIGYGAMVLEGYYGASRDEDAVGTRNIDHLAENAEAAAIRLDEEQLRMFHEIASPGAAQGATLL